MRIKSVIQTAKKKMFRLSFHRESSCTSIPHHNTPEGPWTQFSLILCTRWNSQSSLMPGYHCCVTWSSALPRDIHNSASEGSRICRCNPEILGPRGTWVKPKRPSRGLSQFVYCLIDPLHFNSWNARCNPSQLVERHTSNGRTLKTLHLMFLAV